MAALQERNGSYRVIFNYRGKQRAFTLGRVSEAEAKAKAAQVDYLLMRLKQGLHRACRPASTSWRSSGTTALPAAAADPARSSPHGRSRPSATSATVTSKRTATARSKPTPSGASAATSATSPGSWARASRSASLTLADLQGYVDKRAKAKGRRGTLIPVTIKKEIVTLRTAWNWGVRMGIVVGPLPRRRPALCEGRREAAVPDAGRDRAATARPAATEGGRALGGPLPDLPTRSSGSWPTSRRTPATRGSTRWWRPPPTRGRAGANCCGCGSATSTSRRAS